MMSSMQKQDLARLLFSRSDTTSAGLVFGPADDDSGLLQCECGTPATGKTKESGEHPKKKKKQGTFMGVYIPVAASMWGVIIFIRFSVIVGYSGWVMAVGFVVLSAMVQILTTLSLCAVLSNSTNYSGGTFGILKRNVGGEIAGVVCLLYYLGMTTLASVELLGSVQAIDYVLSATKSYPGDSITGNTYWDQLLLGAPMLCILAFVRAFDVRFVHIITFFILLVVLASYFFGFLGLFLTAGTWRGTLSGLEGLTGLNGDTFMGNALPNFVLPNYTEDELSELFGVSEDMVTENALSGPSASLALIFPMFLGVFQGGNKAADLENPNKSIVKGTLFAILTSFLIYTLLFLLFAAVAERSILKAEFLLLSALTWPTQYIGIVGTVLVGIGACVELLEIGPTVLHAVANDGLFSFLQYLGLHRKTANGEPVRAVVVSFSINVLLLFVTSAFFETLATVVTELFLQAYFVMHMSLVLNEFQQHASWRPTFKYYHWSTALIGCVTTMTLMFYINWQMAVAVLLIALVLLLVAKVIEEPRRKGLATRSLVKGRAIRFMLTDDMLINRALLIRREKQRLEHRTGKVEKLHVIAEQSTENRKTKSLKRKTTSRRINLEKMIQDDEHDEHRFWEPQILCLIDEPCNEAKESSHLKLLHFSEQICARGVLPQLAIVASVLKGTKVRKAKEIDEETLSMRLKLFSLCSYTNLSAFPKVVMSPPASRPEDGYLFLMQAVGVGPLTPNVVIVSFDDPNLISVIEHVELTRKELIIIKDLKPIDYKYISTQTVKLKSSKGMGGSSQLGSESNSTINNRAPTTTNPNLTSIKEDLELGLESGAELRADEQPEIQNNQVSDDRDEDEEEDEVAYQDNMEDLDSLHFNKWDRKKRARLLKRTGTIDVWWITKQGGLPLIIAQLLSVHRVWKMCDIRVFVVIESSQVDDVLTANWTIKVQKMLQSIRVTAIVEVLQVDPKRYTLVRNTTVRDLSGVEDSMFGSNDRTVVLNNEETIKCSTSRRMPGIRDLFSIPSDPEENSRRDGTMRKAAIKFYNELLIKHSGSAELIILGLPTPAHNQEPEKYRIDLDRISKSLQRIAFIHTRSEFDGIERFAG